MNLKKIIFSGNISSVDDTEFGYNFFECEERESYTDPRTFTAPRDMTVVGKRGTVVEEVATRVGVPFISLREADAETFEKITGIFTLSSMVLKLGLYLNSLSQIIASSSYIVRSFTAIALLYCLFTM